MTTLVSYRLRAPGRDYAQLFEAITSVASKAWFGMTSLWIIETSLNPEQLFSRLLPYIDPNDLLFISQLTGQRTGQLDPGDWEKINSIR